MTHLAKDEMLHRMTVLSELGVFPNSMTKFASIMNQKYSGDINIYPELISSNFPRILENPTTEFMQQACLSGERATWPRLSRIRNAVAIELALDRAIQQMRARVAFSPGQVDSRLQESTRHSSDLCLENGSTARGSMRNRRRGSHGHELESRGSRRLSYSDPAQDLRKAHSTVSLENPPLMTSNDPRSVPIRPKAHHQRRSTISGSGALFATGSASDDDEEQQAEEDELLGFSFSIVPPSSKHRGSWDASCYGEELSHGPRSPVRSRRSSFSPGRSQRSGSGQRGSPKRVFAPSPREISMALSPSSRHQLSMTPSVNPSPADSLTRKPHS